MGRRTFLLGVLDERLNLNALKYPAWRLCGAYHVRGTSSDRKGDVVKLLAVLAVIVLVIVGLAIQERRELEKERMRRAKELSLLLQEPTEDPASCEHQWVEYLHGDCYSDYEGQNQWSAPNKCASYTIYKCAKCHATSYTCSCMHHDDRVLTGWDACVGCEYTPNSPGHLREPQPEPSRER